MSVVDKSLADLYIQYAFANTSPRRNRELGMMSTGDLLAMSDDARDVAWLGHAIKRVPGYRIADDVVDATLNLAAKSLISTPSKYITALAENPKLYTPSFPAMWVEFFMGRGSKSDRLSGVLLECLPHNKPGMKLTFVSIDEDSRPRPHANHMIPFFQHAIESVDGKLSLGGGGLIHRQTMVLIKLPCITHRL